MKQVLLLLFILAPCLLLAQNRFEAGLFADYMHLQTRAIDTHHAGLGGRFSVHVYPHLSVGGEMAYDFAQPFRESIGPNCTGPFCPLFPVVLFPANIGFLHGSLGPEFYIGSRHIRVFGTVKGGFINFHLHPNIHPGPLVASSIQNLRDAHTNGVLYSGGGVEFFKSHLGLRIDVGDEIYFNHGANHNLRASFGPVVRF